MIEITGKDLPKDHPYYRSNSIAYRKYLEVCGLRTVPIDEGFGWLKSVGGLFDISKFERLETEPDIALLKSMGFGPGFVIWIPARREEIPKGWRKMWIRTHFTQSGFTVIDSPDYHKKWNERARRARKKFLASGAEIAEVSDFEFMEAFRSTQVKHLYKSDYIKYYRTMAAIAPNDVKSYVARHAGKIVAGLAVLNYGGNSTAHLVAFTGPDAKAIQAGTGLIDRWFSDSLQSGVKYVNFDHLRDASMTHDQQGYTDFKKNFMEYSLSYPDSYFKFVA